MDFAINVLTKYTFGVDLPVVTGDLSALSILTFTGLTAAILPGLALLEWDPIEHTESWKSHTKTRLSWTRISSHRKHKHEVFIYFFTFLCEANRKYKQSTTIVILQ